MFLFNVLQYYIFPLKISNSIYAVLNKILLALLNTKIKIHGNTDALKNDNVLLMSNHYDGIMDVAVLSKLYYNHNKKNIINTVVKHNIIGDPNDKQIITDLLYYVKDSIIKSLYFIPYKRGDREHGKVVKNIIADAIEDNKNILIFPEGTTHIDGISKDFRHGIFQLAVEKKMNILPITLKYDKDIGSERNDPLNLHNLFDNTVDIYIHDLIDCNVDECYKIGDYLGLKQKTFDVILGGAAPTPPTGG
jgi:1-acyl-sn-glycerol-3-phosphate acyltransferase